jgi:hypothetical protein
MRLRGGGGGGGAPPPPPPPRGGGGGGGGAGPTSTIAGKAVKGPIVNAEIRLYTFDAAGAEVEIVAANAPVRTDAAGAFSFQVDPASLTGPTPLIVNASGGLLGGQPAPLLEAVIVDPIPLSYSQITVTCHLSAASTVAAGLLRKLAQDRGAPPSLGDARSIADQVKDQLGADLALDPSDPRTSTGLFNHCVDQNLDLIDTPANNPAADELIAYLVANLRSVSGALDGAMDSPTSPGTDVPASFAPFPLLSSLFPAGPAGLTFVRIRSDRDHIENSGKDTVLITATLVNAAGAPAAGLNSAQLALLSGPGLLLWADPAYDYGAGSVRAELTSAGVGDNLVCCRCLLPNLHAIDAEIVVPAVDLVSDVDDDGLADGVETLGWTIVVDTLGYGISAVPSLLEIRKVTSDPDSSDTDGDGLDDYTEYLLRTDPTKADTDGDGLSDYDEWYRWISCPSSVDTDGDARGPLGDQAPNPALFDGNELQYLRTSPTLDDTDGDGKTDYEEADNPVRSPLVADLPRIEVAIVDTLDVRLDVEYSEEAGLTRQYGTECSRSTTHTTSTYNENSVNCSMTIGVEHSFGLTGGTKMSMSLTAGYGHTWATTEEDSTTAQQSYSEYTTDSRTRTETAATGSITTGIQLKNQGKVTFTLTQLGFTIRQWVPGIDPDDPDAPGSFKTLATLTPALGGGITLAPGATSPVLQVQALGLNASRVKEFLARPSSLYVEPAYYELENAEGLNYAYLEEITGPRTARVIVDFGDGRSEQYRVATNVQRNPGGAYAGIALGEVLRDVLRIPFATRTRREIDPGAATDERVLYSVRDVATMPDPARGFWMVVRQSGIAIPPATDFESVVLRGGEGVTLLFVRDEDGDGLFGPEEQHFRTDDGASQDTDGDGLTDMEEVRGRTFTDAEGHTVRCGWAVEVFGPAPRTYPVVSDPAAVDQDGDGLNDFEERTRGTDPAVPDTDQDGIPDGADPHPCHFARVVYVKADAAGSNDGNTWANAFTDLQDALQVARDGLLTPGDPYDDVAEIWVAAGIYKPDASDRTVSFSLVDTVGIYGGFSGMETKRSQRYADPVANGTILSGDLQDNDAVTYQMDPPSFADNSLHVCRAGTDVGAGAVLDGFMVMAGNANLAGANQGGGLFIEGSPSLQNLFVRSNHAAQGGGLATGPASTVRNVSDCVFNRNVADAHGGGIFVGNLQAEIALARCEISENETLNGGSNGGGLHGAACRMNMTDCLIKMNRAYDGGGCVVRSASTARFERCRIIQNEGTNGAGGILGTGGDTSILVQQCLLSGNVGRNVWLGTGAVFVSNDVYLWLVNSTVCNNSASGSLLESQSGGVFIVDGCYGGVENCVLWGNWAQDGSTAGRQLFVNSSAVRVRTSCIQNNWELSYLVGNGNIGTDPKFVNDAALDYRLTSDSPCIDTGSNYVDYDPMTTGFQLLPDADLDGRPRIVDGNGDGDAIVDMGALEFQR